MQAYSKFGIGFREANRLIESFAIGHEAGAGDDAFLMRFDNALINRGRPAEIVGVDNQLASNQPPLPPGLPRFERRLSAAPFRN